MISDIVFLDWRIAIGVMENIRETRPTSHRRAAFASHGEIPVWKPCEQRRGHSSAVTQVPVRIPDGEGIDANPPRQSLEAAVHGRGRRADERHYGVAEEMLYARNQDPSWDTAPQPEGCGRPAAGGGICVRHAPAVSHTSDMEHPCIWELGLLCVRRVAAWGPSRPPPCTRLTGTRGVR